MFIGSPFKFVVAIVAGRSVVDDYPTKTMLRQGPENKTEIIIVVLILFIFVNVTIMLWRGG